MGHCKRFIAHADQITPCMHKKCVVPLVGTMARFHGAGKEKSKADKADKKLNEAIGALVSGRRNIDQ